MLRVGCNTVHQNIARARHFNRRGRFMGGAPHLDALTRQSGSGSLRSDWRGSFNVERDAHRIEYRRQEQTQRWSRYALTQVIMQLLAQAGFEPRHHTGAFASQPRKNIEGELSTEDFVGEF